MKKFFQQFAGLGLLVALLIAVGCGEEPTTPDTPLGPEARFIIEQGYISSSTTLSPGVVFKVKLSASAGDNNLKSLTIRSNGSTLGIGTDQPLKSIKVDGNDVTNNPLLITSAYGSGATWEIEIEAQKDLGTKTYEFVVADEKGLTDAVTLDIEVFGTFGLSLVDENPYVANDIELSGQGETSVKLKGDRGAYAIRSLAVYADGVAVSADSLTYNGVAFGANPYSLPAADQNGFEAVVTLGTHDDGTKTYTFEITDDNGAKVSTGFDVNVKNLPQFSAVVVNNADGPNLGGLDLDTGLAVPYNSANAEIRDKGIDLAKPIATNWLQKIEPRNGAVLRIPDSGQSENFTYANAKTRAAIIAAFDSGISKTESDVVKVGDLFIIQRGDDYFLLECADISVTSGDNLDYYKFNVKQALKE